MDIKRKTMIGFTKSLGAFTLVELLVAVSVLALLMIIIMSITNSVTKTVRWNNAKLEAFAASRTAFDIISGRLATATLNTYWDYDENPLASSSLATSGTAKPPTTYLRQSDLYFLVQQNSQNPGYGQEVYFQTPESFSNDPSIRSTQGLLNACSFFVQFCNNSDLLPNALQSSVTAPRWRYRLMQGNQSSEKMSVYQYTYALNNGQENDPKDAKGWINSISNGGAAEIRPDVTPIADNVIALIIWPRLSSSENSSGDTLTTNYLYDSRKDAFVTIPSQPITANQLPPTIQITLITISEASARRLDTGSNPPSIIENALRNKFQNSNTTRFNSDIADLSAQLDSNHIEYQIFNTSVTIRESKWSGATQ